MKMVLTSSFGIAAPLQALTPSRDRHYVAELEELRGIFEKGSLAALLEAMYLCEEREKERELARKQTSTRSPGRGDPGDDALGAHGWSEIPPWAFEAAIRHIRAGIATAVSRPRGRSAKWVQQWKQDRIDLDRWEAVNFLRGRGIGFTNRRHGGDLDTIFDKASQYVRGLAAGSAETIKKSYQRVQRRMKTEPWRYRHLNRVITKLSTEKPEPRALVWYE
jgi:hypothetical protein